MEAKVNYSEKKLNFLVEFFFGQLELPKRIPSEALRNPLRPLGVYFQSVVTNGQSDNHKFDQSIHDGRSIPTMDQLFYHDFKIAQCHYCNSLCETHHGRAPARARSTI